jgi:hypothetical protein
LVASGKYVNDIQAITRQLPITTIEKLLKMVFSVGSAPRLYIKDPKLAEKSVEGWQFSCALQG